MVLEVLDLLFDDALMILHRSFFYFLRSFLFKSFLEFLSSRSRFATLSYLDGWCVFNATDAVP